MQLLRRFLCNRKGNIAPIFGLAIIPVVGIVALSVDYSRGNAVKADVQSALDATALALSKEADGMLEKDLKSRAEKYFRAVFNRPEARIKDISPKLTKTGTGGFELVITGEVSVPASFMRMVANGELDIGGRAEVKWGFKKLEIALALDNTGSMASSNKMTHLKTAVHSLLDQLKKASKTPGDVKVAIIPFNQLVNIGTASKNEPWFDVEAACAIYNISNCGSFDWRAHWQGCVRDRKYPYDVQDDAPGTKNGTLYPVVLCDPQVAPVLPLTSDWTALGNRVNEMQPNGNTNVTIGLVWAWHMLTQSAPYTLAAAPAADLDKVIILLTDGQNTESWNNASHKTVTNTTHIDARTKLACDNVKAANIKLYTVRVIDGNASLLRDCASKPSSMYFEVSQASQLNGVFEQIYDNLASLRISK
jgi:Mg-chelatase subunit ChlD